MEERVESVLTGGHGGVWLPVGGGRGVSTCGFERWKRLNFFSDDLGDDASVAGRFCVVSVLRAFLDLASKIDLIDSFPFFPS